MGNPLTTTSDPSMGRIASAMGRGREGGAVYTMLDAAGCAWNDCSGASLMRKGMSLHWTASTPSPPHLLVALLRTHPVTWSVSLLSSHFGAPRAGWDWVFLFTPLTTRLASRQTGLWKINTPFYASHRPRTEATGRTGAENGSRVVRRGLESVCYAPTKQGRYRTGHATHSPQRPGRRY
jgi:hypothetical protein